MSFLKEKIGDDELFIQWYKDAPDKGIHTYNVLSQTETFKKIILMKQKLWKE